MGMFIGQDTGLLKSDLKMIATVKISSHIFFSEVDLLYIRPRFAAPSCGGFASLSLSLSLSL